MRKSVILGEREFSSKKEALEEILRIRDAYESRSDTIEDEQLLRSLILRHPDSENKIGAGVRCFFVKRIMWNTKAFFIRRYDGTECDFSFMHCLSNPTHKERVSETLRACVSFISAQRKKEAISGGRHCPFTYEKLSSNNCQVVHLNPRFLTIVNGFANQEGGIKNVILSESKDKQIGRTLLSKSQEARWIVYYQKHARPMVVSEGINLSALYEKA